ncbi:MAG: PIN domain-containing protein [Gemmatimonadota bacterium]
MGLISDLGSGPVAIDTAAIIYLVERHPRYLPILRPCFMAADQGDLELVTSAITLLEVLVVPYRAGNLALAERYEALLTRSRGLEVVELDDRLLRTAAKLRARWEVRTPDALQLAAGLLKGCSAFVTNDRRIPESVGLRIIQLSDYL